MAYDVVNPAQAGTNFDAIVTERSDKGFLDKVVLTGICNNPFPSLLGVIASGLSRK